MMCNVFTLIGLIIVIKVLHNEFKTDIFCFIWQFWIYWHNFINSFVIFFFINFRFGEIWFLSKRGKSSGSSILIGSVIFFRILKVKLVSSLSDRIWFGEYLFAFISKNGGKVYLNDCKNPNASSERITWLCYFLLLLIDYVLHKVNCFSNSDWMPSLQICLKRQMIVAFYQTLQWVLLPVDQIILHF